jgi:hypothetical protein
MTDNDLVNFGDVLIARPADIKYINLREQVEPDLMFVVVTFNDGTTVKWNGRNLAVRAAFDAFRSLFPKSFPTGRTEPASAPESTPQPKTPLSR